MTSHSQTQLSLQMADDLRRESFRLRSSSHSRLNDLCELWVKTYENSMETLAPATVGSYSRYTPAADQKSSRIVADSVVREAMPLWLWVTIGQILLKLIWQWWQNREENVRETFYVP